uniref:Uncharacterized protein LOC100179204 n=1 Tax=Phallusia mammillata TaxID=59560 RepID=A0A6F9DHW1_9ASCI|nr:uncharacterized protein LOC100179204 [Phallusia mammillata]
MSFMYKSMVSRAPGKRKIKLQEENILRLMQEENDGDEEEDDCDFEINANKSTLLSESESDEESESASETSKSTSDGETESRQEGNSRSEHHSSLPRQHRHKYDVVAPTLPGTSGFLPSHQRFQNSLSESQEKIAKQWRILRQNVLKGLNKPELVCCICLKNQHPNKILVCSKCGIAVHQDCYHGNKPDSKPDWFCSSCLSEKSKDCDFCPSQDGCLRETSSGQWCHVICARYILRKNVFNEKNLIDFSMLNTKLYGSKECILCDDVVMSKTGICIKCDAGLCKSFFHVTCAQKYGLLSENDSNVDSETDPYFVYCPLHVTKEIMTHSQKLYITTFESIRLRMEAQIDENHNKVLFSQAVVHHEPSQSSSLVLRGHPPQRYLSSNASAMRMFQQKAKNALNINIATSYFPRPSDVRKRHHVVPALTPEFASHFADRELRILEYTEHLRQSSEENQHFLSLESEYRNKYQQLQQNLESLKAKENETLKLSQNLFSHVISLKQWAVANQKNKSGDLVKLKLKPQVTMTDSKSPQRKRPSQETIKSRSPKMSKSSSLLKLCDICHDDNNQHMMVDCGICLKWFHLNCLDPPLLQMPRKSKFSLWQCSKCAPSSDSDSDDISRGSLVTAEGRRVTRRSHRPPDKLVAVSDTDIVQQQRMISYFSRSINKSNLKKKISMKKRLKNKKQVIKKTFLENEKQESPGNSIKSPSGTSPTKSLIIPVGRDFSPTVKLELVELEKKQAEKLKGNYIVPVSTQLMSKTDLLAALGKLVPSANSQSGGATSSLVRLQGDFFQKNNVAIRKPIILPSHKIIKADGVKPVQTASVAAIVRTTMDGNTPVSEQPTILTTNTTTSKAAPTCKVCGTTQSPEKMMSCTKCLKYFHIWCCDPPYKTMPRTNRFCQWECADCGMDADDGDDNDADVEVTGEGGGMEQTPDGRKRITRRRKPPEKFSHLFDMSLQRRLENTRRRRLIRNKKRASMRTNGLKRGSVPPHHSSSSSDEDDVVDLTNEEPADVAMTTDTPDAKVSSTGGSFNMPVVVQESRNAKNEPQPSVESHNVDKTSLPSIIRLYSQLSTSNDNLPATFKVNYDKQVLGGGTRTLTSIKQLLKTKNNQNPKEKANPASATVKRKSENSESTKNQTNKTDEAVSEKNSTKPTLDVSLTSNDPIVAPSSVTTKPSLCVEPKQILPSVDQIEASVDSTAEVITSIATSQTMPSSVQNAALLPSIATSPKPTITCSSETSGANPSVDAQSDDCDVTTTSQTPSVGTNTISSTSDKQSTETSINLKSSESNLTAEDPSASITDVDECNIAPPSKPCAPPSESTNTDMTTAPLSGEPSRSVDVSSVSELATAPSTVKSENMKSEECEILPPSGNDTPEVQHDIPAKKSDTIAPTSEQKVASSTYIAPSHGRVGMLPPCGSQDAVISQQIIKSPSSDDSKAQSNTNTENVSDINTVPPSDEKNTPAVNVCDEKCDPCEDDKLHDDDQPPVDVAGCSDAVVSTNTETTHIGAKVAVAKTIWPITISTSQIKLKDTQPQERKIMPRIAAKQPEKIITTISQPVKVIASCGSKILNVRTAYTPVIPPSVQTLAHAVMEKPQKVENSNEVETVGKKHEPVTDPALKKRVTLVLPRVIGNPVVKTTSASSGDRLVSINAVKKISVPIVLKHSPTTEKPPT